MKNGLAATLFLVSAVGSVCAQTAPEQINYQCKVEVRGVPFDGVGQFKFAIVDQAGTNSYWSNDGTSVTGNEPTEAVSLNVKGGLLSVPLGNEAIPNMTKIPASVFDQQDRHVRLWFGGASGGSFEKLLPDNPLASVPYALMAQAVPDDSLSGEKFMRESVWPVHAGRDNTIVSYYAAYFGTNMVAVGTIASNKNFIITDVVNGTTEWASNAYHVDIRYTKDALDTILIRMYAGSPSGMPYEPKCLTFRSGLVVPGGATLKIGGLKPGGNDYPNFCVVSGFEIAVE